MNSRSVPSLDLFSIFEDSEDLFSELLGIFLDMPMPPETKKHPSASACSLSIEHWQATRMLLQADLLPSAVVVHRAQFEAAVRSVWLSNSANDEQIRKLSATLNTESEQAAKNFPSVADMLSSIAKDAPTGAYVPLARFKDQSWNALNSYAHAGIHPLSRHSNGYPEQLTLDVLRNANGLGLFACMQAVALMSRLDLQPRLFSIANKYKDCLPNIVAT